MTASWETLISSVDEGEVLPGAAAVFVHTPEPTGTMIHHAIVREGTSENSVMDECPVTVQPKAECVIDIARAYHTGAMPWTKLASAPGHMLPPLDSMAVEYLQEVMATKYRSSG